MPYVYSRARKSFDLEIRQLLVSSRDADHWVTASADTRNLVHASAIILASSKFESYLENLLLDWANAIASSGIVVSQLPSATRAFLLNGSVIRSAYRKLLLLEHGEKDFLRLIAAQIGLNGEYRYAIDATSVNAPHLRTILKDTKYPSEANLMRLFARCGIENVFTSLNRIARKDVLALHKSFSDLRTQIAHQGLPVGINGADVRSRIQGVGSVVGYLDRVFYAHSSKLLGATIWTT